MLTEYLLEFALLGAEWVLWLLIALSIGCVAIMIERTVFYWRRNVNIDSLRVHFEKHLENDDYEAAKSLLGDRESMEANVVLFGLQEYHRGPEAVEDRMQGALASEKTRYEKRLPFLGTIGNNAPFIGLFGTVIGIIGAFANLSIGSKQASDAVMGAISEALIATGVGILVAIPAVMAFNACKARVKRSVSQTELLGRLLLSNLRTEPDQEG